MNPILQQTKDAILKKADPRMVPVIKKIEAAGLKVMYSEKTREMMVKQLGDGKDPELIGAGVAKLVGILYGESRKTAPMQALMPAAVLLLCEGLDFLEQAGAVQVDADFLSECTLAMGSSVAQLFGATPDKLQGMLDKAGPGKAAPVEQASPTGQAPGGILANVQGGM